MNRILIVRMSALGDIVHALPVVAALHDADHTVEIDWLSDSAYAGILELVEGLTNRIVVRPGYASALRFMRSRKYDAAVDLQGLWKSATAARLSGAKRIIGFETRALREKGAAWFYSETAPVPDAAHIIQKNMAVLPLLGVTRPAVRFPFRVPASRVASEIEQQTRTGGAEGYVLLNPGAAWRNKRWPADRYGALAWRIRSRFSMPSFVLWGRGESELADRVVAASAGAASRAPETMLGDVLAVSLAAKLMVSGDTGPLHLAATMGTPIVGLYGPTWPQRNGPWDPNDEVVSRATTCVCHHKRECQRANRCIDEITVDEVFEAVERRLVRTRLA